MTGRFGALGTAHKIGRKVVLTIAAAMVVAILAVFLLAQVVIGSAFQRLEEDDARESWQRARQTLDEDLRVLGLTTRDWAQWNDS